MQADQITLVRMTTEKLTDYSSFPWCSIYQLGQEAVGVRVSVGVQVGVQVGRRGQYSCNTSESTCESMGYLKHPASWMWGTPPQ